MQNIRPLLFIAWLITGFLIWQAWTDFHRPAVPEFASETPAAAASLADGVPQAPADVPDPGAVPTPLPAVPGSATPEPVQTASAGQTVTVTTDVLRLQIDTQGGTLISAQLLAYPVSAGAAETVELLNNDPATRFWAQSGLVSADGNAPDHNALFQAGADSYQLTGDQLEVPLTWTDGNGLTVRKVYVLHRGSYAIDVRHEIDNGTGQDWSASVYRQLQRIPLRGSRGFSFTDISAVTFHGAAWYSPEERFEKFKFEDFQSRPEQRTVTGGWAAMLQHYFFAAWIPAPDQVNEFSTLRLSDNRHLVRQTTQLMQVSAGAQAVDHARLWVGPKLQKTLPDVADGLELTIDYGMFTVLSKPLFWVLDKIYSVVNNWGLAIILITVLIKLAFYRLSKTQYISMARMRKMQPRLAQLKERYGDDRQKLNAAMMDLYKKEKINPLGGCLPILVQIPVFISLYWVLLESVELRQAPFVLWIQDLSARDPYFVLPVLNGAVMWLTQKLSPSPGVDPIQQRIFQAMPIVFSVMFAFFPAGLVLYWTTNGALGLLQQWHINKRIAAGQLK